MKKYRKPQATRYTLFHELCASPTEPLPEAWQRTQLTSMWDGLAQLETGATPGPEDWSVCSDAVNLLETLIKQGEVEDTQGLLSDAITALAQAGQRHKAGQTLRLSGLGMQAVRAVLEDYAAVMSVLPARVMIRCHRLTERRIREILQGKELPYDVQVMAV